MPAVELPTEPVAAVAHEPEPVAPEIPVFSLHAGAGRAPDSRACDGRACNGGPGSIHRNRSPRPSWQLRSWRSPLSLSPRQSFTRCSQNPNRSQWSQPLPAIPIVDEIPQPPEPPKAPEPAPVLSKPAPPDAPLKRQDVLDPLLALAEEIRAVQAARAAALAPVQHIDLHPDPHPDQHRELPGLAELAEAVTHQKSPAASHPDSNRVESKSAPEPVVEQESTATALAPVETASSVGVLETPAQEVKTAEPEPQPVALVAEPSRELDTMRMPSFVPVGAISFRTPRIAAIRVPCSRGARRTCRARLPFSA